MYEIDVGGPSNDGGPTLISPGRQKPPHEMLLPFAKVDSPLAPGQLENVLVIFDPQSLQGIRIEAIAKTAGAKTLPFASQEAKRRREFELSSEDLTGVNRVMVIGDSIPTPAKKRNQEFEVLPIKSDQALSEFAKETKYQPADLDEALITYQSGGIKALREKGVAEDIIRTILRGEKAAEGMSAFRLEQLESEVREFVEKTDLNGDHQVFLIPSHYSAQKIPLLMEELALKHQDSRYSVMQESHGELNFEGRAEAGTLIQGINWEALGYRNGDVTMTHHEDSQGVTHVTLNFRASPKTWSDSFQRIPKPILSYIHQVANGKKNAEVPDPADSHWYEFESRISGIQREFRITPEELSAASKNVDQSFLNETLFVLPNNDGESFRSLQILRALKAKNVRISDQAWGATLDKENLRSRDIPEGVRRIVTFELPSPEKEEKLRKEGFEVIPIDHHFYHETDRQNPKSSLEQLMEMVGWQPSERDLAIATNDRSFIPGMKAMGLSNEEIRKIRKLDTTSQGRTEKQDYEQAVKKAQQDMKALRTTAQGFYILNNSDNLMLMQELALEAPDGVINTVETGFNRFGFKGASERVQRLLAVDFEALGYRRESFKKYGGGDPKFSMFFGFKPSSSPKGWYETLPKEIEDYLLKVANGENPDIPTPPKRGFFGGERPRSFDDDVSPAEFSTHRPAQQNEASNASPRRTDRKPAAKPNPPAKAAQVALGRFPFEQSPRQDANLKRPYLRDTIFVVDGNTLENRRIIDILKSLEQPVIVQTPNAFNPKLLTEGTRNNLVLIGEFSPAGKRIQSQWSPWLSGRKMTIIDNSISERGGVTGTGQPGTSHLRQFANLIGYSLNAQEQQMSDYASTGVSSHDQGLPEYAFRQLLMADEAARGNFLTHQMREDEIWKQAAEVAKTTVVPNVKNISFIPYQTTAEWEPFVSAELDLKARRFQKPVSTFHYAPNEGKITFRGDPQTARRLSQISFGKHGMLVGKRLNGDQTNHMTLEIDFLPSTGEGKEEALIRELEKHLGSFPRKQ